MTKDVKLTKEQFIRYMEELQEICKLEDNLNDALKAMSPDFGGYHNEKATSLIVNLLKDMMDDRQEVTMVDGSWSQKDWSDIEYYIYDMNWGQDADKYPITFADGRVVKLTDFGKLYDYLVSGE